MPRRRPSGCLGDELSEYAGGRLTPQRTVTWDRHLVACEFCRAQVQEERQFQAALRAASVCVPDALRSALLAVGTSLPTVASEPLGVPLAPASAAVTAYLPTVSPGSAPLHRSALRSAVLAGVVVGASTAAAWGVSAAAGPTAAPVVARAVRSASPVASVTQSAAVWTLNRSAVFVTVPIGAESTP